MKNTPCDAAEIWKQFEDLLVPHLGLSVNDRAAYSHLLRHSRIEGKVLLRFSIQWLALGIGLCSTTARDAVRRLVNRGALRLLARTKAGHVVEVRLPAEIPGIGAQGNCERLPAAAGELGSLHGNTLRAAGTDLYVDVCVDSNIENIDFMQSPALRRAIHAREGGACFYCLRRLASGMQGLDHVVPRAHSGNSSYRNLVSCCLDCNSQKGEKPAGDFLRWLYREGRLTAVELTDRLRALEELAAGKLQPAFAEAGLRLPCLPQAPRGAAQGPASSPLYHVAPGFSPASFPPAISSKTVESSQEIADDGKAAVLRLRSGQASRSTPKAPSAFGEARSHEASSDSASVSTTALSEIERRTILRVYEQAHGDKALAGKMLGISRATLYRKLKRYNIPLRVGEVLL